MLAENKLCFSSFVFGKYQKFIPYYIYSIGQTYPKSYIKIFVDSSLEAHIHRALQILKENGISNFETVKLDIDTSVFSGMNIKGGNKKLVRWLVNPKYFENYEYIYIGDIDIFFLPEKTSLLDLHINQMNLLNVPFSNKVRRDRNGLLSNRLTGLHFIKTQEYYNKIHPVLKRLESNREYRKTYLSNIERDEQFLYKINKEVFNFDDEILSRAKRPWHGVHLGITRGNSGLDINSIKDNASLSIPEIQNYLTQYTKNPIFKAIQQEVFVQEFEVILRKLKIQYPISWWWKSFKLRTRNKLWDIKRIIKEVLK